LCRSGDLAVGRIDSIARRAGLPWLSAASVLAHSPAVPHLPHAHPPRPAGMRGLRCRLAAARGEGGRGLRLARLCSWILGCLAHRGGGFFTDATSVLYNWSLTSTQRKL